MFTPDLLLDSLPQSFEFYHLGRIERAPGEAPGTDSVPTDPASDDRLAFAYQLQGDARGLLILTLAGAAAGPAALDEYAEAGNVLASGLANDLYARHGLDVLPSPPRVLTGTQLRRLLGRLPGRGPAAAPTFRYVHHRPDRTVPLEVTWLAAPPTSEETGHA